MANTTTYINKIVVPNGSDTITANLVDTVSGYTKNTGTVTSVAAGTGLVTDKTNNAAITTSGTISLDTTRALTVSDITTGTDTTNKLVSAKTLADSIDTLVGGPYVSMSNGDAFINNDGDSNGIISQYYVVGGYHAVEVGPNGVIIKGATNGDVSVTNLKSPTNDYDAANKKYVDDTVAGLDSSISATTSQAISAITITDGKITGSTKINVGDANQNAFSNVKVGNDTIAADSTTDTLELVAGTGITLTADTTNDKVTITSTATGGVTDVQVNSTSIVSSGTANLVTNTAYNASTNKIATMADVDVMTITYSLISGTDYEMNISTVLAPNYANTILGEEY